MFKQIEKEYIDKGLVKYYFMDFPLAFHKQAPRAHEAANCAGAQGQYWQMHSVIFANQKAISPEDLDGYAKDLGLDVAEFKACLERGDFKDEMTKDIAEGRKAGVRGTPSFLLGQAKPGEQKVYAVKFMRGAKPFQEFKSEIDSLLKEIDKKNK